MGVCSTVIKHNEPNFNNNFLEITEAPKPPPKCWNRITNYYDSCSQYNDKRRTPEMKSRKNTLHRQNRQKNKSKFGDYTSSRIVDEYSDENDDYDFDNDYDLNHFLDDILF